ncbi:hypothetical protein SAMN05421766_101517 [Zobellia uliginosa]|uniref:Adhesin domain-containing protein n=1 Tax=Zobellia uliginosa TaxID=143224 RepID=A0ABY1KMK1_9FLAO|nr:hypothetical protein [Zobellia uliginosa]SIS39939.1 hypothetical protein SAMN05421766_101517 [Zobellia uliginosa]
MRFFVILFLSFHLLSAQKVVRKSLVNSEITSINIDVTNCYKLAVETVPGTEMSVEATIDGEYMKDLLVSVKKEGNSIMVSSGFQPNFHNPNDKLSAHKVVSIALKVVLPQYKYVTVFGTSCNVLMSGDYTDLNVSLNDGRCALSNVSENVNVHTQSGSIWLAAKSGNIQVINKYGTVERDNIPFGDTKYTLTTVTGNIQITKTE